MPLRFCCGIVALLCSTTIVPYAAAAKPALHSLAIRPGVASTSTPATCGKAGSLFLGLDSIIGPL